jgi:hypothetical protein
MTAAPNAAIELAFIDTFVVRPKRARYCPSTSLAYYEGQMRYRFILDSKGLRGAR